MILDLDLRDLESVELVMVRRPFTSVVAQVADTVGAVRGGLSQSWRESLQSKLGRQQMASLRVLRFVVPAELKDPTGESGLSIDERVQQVFDSDGAGLPEFITHVYRRPPPPLLSVMDNPRRFLTVAGSSIRRVADPTRQVWRRAAPLLDREERRVIAAGDSRAGKQSLLTSLIPGTIVSGYILRSPESRGQLGRLAPRVELMPLIAGSTASMVGIAPGPGDGLIVDQIGYPLPGGTGLLEGPGHPVADEFLVALLGEPRAQILQALEAPRSMGDLAARVDATPSRVTYHCDQLVAAGLADRERQGNRVVVSRSPRGSELVELMNRPISW